MMSVDPNDKTGGFVLDMAIRWNSSFLLLERVVKYKDALDNMFAFPNNIIGLIEKQKKRLKELPLNQDEWDLLTIIKNILKPFLSSTIVLCVQSHPTLAASYYVYHDLSFFLRLTADDGPITTALKQSLRFCFNIFIYYKLVGINRENIANKENNIPIVAAFLDPAVYNELDNTDRMCAKKLIFRKLANASIHHNTLSSSSTPQTTTTKSNAFQKLAVACVRVLPSSISATKTMTLDEEISNYIKLAKSVDNFQEFWVVNAKQLPRLANLVRRVNVIPATEAFFSIANFIQRKQRSSLSLQTLRYLLVLRKRTFN
ncbi:unnamed protein product [Didymodactylos carnosus]|nr:unnamed protein product [Didymodactylos carnosus]CAF4298208.1 unnamed protein product [Didymodactylos carnosus]